MNGDDIVTMLSDFVLRPKVVHSLPGRMRISFPVLKKAKGNKVPEQMYGTMAGLFPGVLEIAPNFVTANVLVKYDTKVTTESVVLSSFVTVTKTLVAHRSQLLNIPEEKRDITFRKITDYLTSVTPSRLSQEKELELPDEIWS